MSEAAHVPFALPDIGQEEIDEVCDTLRSGWITTGPKVKAFESEFAEYVGAKHAVALNSCTAALHLSLEALGIGPGDEVILPTNTFTATAEVVCYLGAKPVLVDCRASDHQISVEGIEAALGPATKAIIPVHFAGQPCDLDEISSLAEARGLPIVEDAAHALPCEYRERRVGSIGRVTCFSFYATKTITTGEGGMATTDDVNLANRIRMMSLHGISKDAWLRYTKAGTWRYDVLEAGYKYNMTDIAAAMGRVQLKRARDMAARRAEIAVAYRSAFTTLEGVELLENHDDRTHANHLFVLRIDEARAGVSRDELVDLLRERNIGTSVHFIPLHLHTFYRDKLGVTPESFPISTACYERSLSLPIYSKMTEADVDYVVEQVSSLVAGRRP